MFLIFHVFWFFLCFFFFYFFCCVFLHVSHFSRLSLHGSVTRLMTLFGLYEYFADMCFCLSLQICLTPGIATSGEEMLVDNPVKQGTKIEGWIEGSWVVWWGPEGCGAQNFEFLTPPPYRPSTSTFGSSLVTMWNPSGLCLRLVVVVLLLFLQRSVLPFHFFCFFFFPPFGPPHASIAGTFLWPWPK